jgi:hypothetical protein
MIFADNFFREKQRERKIGEKSAKNRRKIGENRRKIGEKSTKFNFF